MIKTGIIMIIAGVIAGIGSSVTPFSIQKYSDNPYFRIILDVCVFIFCVSILAILAGIILILLYFAPGSLLKIGIIMVILGTIAGLGTIVFPSNCEVNDGGKDFDRKTNICAIILGISIFAVVIGLIFIALHFTLSLEGY